MKFKLWRTCAMVSVSLALFAGCGQREQDRVREGVAEVVTAPAILTTFYPTQYFTERIAGEFAKVSCPLPAGEDPIFWMPSAVTIQNYQKADLIIVNGAGFEKWIDKVALPTSRVIDTAIGFKGEWVRYETAVVHKHGPEGEHSHEGVDGHTWVDPHLAILQCGAIRDALVKRWPDKESEFSAAYELLEADLQSFDLELKKMANQLGNRVLIASHPAYNYLAKRYGLNIQSLDLDPGTLLDASELKDIAQLVATLGSKHLLWESPPIPALAEQFASLGLKNILFSPCETPPPSEGSDDYLSVMRANMARLGDL